MITLQFLLLFAVIEFGHADTERGQQNLLPAVCGQNNVSRIVGGRPARPHSWPWMVGVYEGQFEDTLRFICGGSIINRRFVLSAAHCVVSDGRVTMPDRIRLLLGAHNRTRCESNRTNCDGQWVRADRVIYHPNFNETTMQNDIVLFRLERPINFTRTIAPICVANNTFNGIDLTGENATVTGWGSVRPNGPGTEILMQVILPIVSQQVCIAAYGDQNINRLTLCAGLMNGGKDSCSGDSGGPLAIRRDGCWTQVGIVSWGNSCALAGYPGVYTRVSRQYNWIIRQLRNGGNGGKVLDIVQPVIESTSLNITDQFY